jgi:hypothetical protein
MVRSAKKESTSKTLGTREHASINGTAKDKSTQKTIKAKISKKAYVKHKKKATRRSKEICFVLMPFKEPFNTYYDTIIKPAVDATGMESKRGDSLFRPSPIMGDIWAMIQNAKILVAELTEKNANVFYELGLGHAIGKPIVLISETIADVPFDLQPLRVILYDKDNPAWGDKLRSDLIASLAETIADPANAVPPMFRKKVDSQAPEESKTSSRLSALERQLASLQLTNYTSSPRRDLGASFVYNEFQNAVKDAKTTEEIAEAVQWALRSGMPESVVEAHLRYLGLNETLIESLVYSRNAIAARRKYFA